MQRCLAYLSLQSDIASRQMVLREVERVNPVNSAMHSAPTHPSGDKRFKILDATLRKQQFRPDALIEVLHKAQELFDYLEEDVLLYVARALLLPPSRVYGVATFYHLFTLKPQGKHNCIVCLGTACFVNNAEKLLTEAEKQTGIKSGEMTADKRISLSVARCIGACGIAPVVVYDGTTAGQQTPKAVIQHIQKWLSNGSK